MSTACRRDVDAAGLKGRKQYSLLFSGGKKNLEGAFIWDFRFIQAFIIDFDEVVLHGQVEIC